MLDWLLTSKLFQCTYYQPHWFSWSCVKTRRPGESAFHLSTSLVPPDIRVARWLTGGRATAETRGSGSIIQRNGLNDLILVGLGYPTGWENWSTRRVEGNMWYVIVMLFIYSETGKIVIAENTPFAIREVHSGYHYTAQIPTWCIFFYLKRILYDLFSVTPSICLLLWVF